MGLLAYCLSEGVRPQKLQRLEYSCSLLEDCHIANVLRGKKHFCSPEELLRGPRSLARSAPCALYREPISLEDVMEKEQR